MTASFLGFHYSLMQQSSSSSHVTTETTTEAFHSLLQDALIQAQAEGLLGEGELHPDDAELKIIAPSLALYFAALLSEGSPPSITSPNNDQFQLSLDNCPSSFLSFFTLWQDCVPKVKRLDLEKRHDLALLLCEREPASSPIRMEVVALARDFKAVAVNIVQVSKVAVNSISVVVDTGAD
jgi:hypothetical protein